MPRAIGRGTAAAGDERCHGEVPVLILHDQDKAGLLRSSKCVELNAVNSEDFITWIEGNLKEQGIQQVVPEAVDIEVADRRVMKIAFINQQIS